MQDMQEMWVQYLGWEDPLEEGMVTYCSIFVGRILFCPVSESLSGKREGFQDNAILESGLSAATNAVVQGQKNLKQRLLAKFIRYA